MLILHLECAEWRQKALEESFGEVAGAATGIKAVANIGLLQDELLSKAQLLLVPPRLECENQVYETQDLHLLSWYLATSHPRLQLIQFRGEDEDSVVEPWSDNFPLETFPYPESPEAYGEWVASFCEAKGIAYQTPAPSKDWWSERRWLLWTDENPCVASSKIADTELVADLVSFFHLKTHQILDCLDEKEWLNCSLEGEDPAIELIPGRGDSVAFTQALKKGKKADLTDEMCESLAEMGFLSIDH